MGSQDVLTFNPRRTLPSSTTKPLAGSASAHFQPTTNHACSTTDTGMEPGWAENGRRPQRDGLSLPFSATKVLHTVRSVTPGAAGGSVAKRGTVNIGVFSTLKVAELAILA